MAGMMCIVRFVEWRLRDEGFVDGWEREPESVLGGSRCLRMGSRWH